MGAVFPFLYDTPFDDEPNIISYLLNLSPTLTVRYNELAGNTLNYGSDGNTGTPTNCTQGQVGKLGPNEAYLFDGANSKLTFLNASLPGTKALTSQRWLFLCNPSSLGETNFGAFFYWGDGTGADGHFMRFDTNNRILVRFQNTVAANFDTETNIGEVASIIGNWSCIFMDLDNAGTRKPRLWKGAGGVVTPLTLALNQAVAGTLLSPPAVLNLGNRTSVDATFAGLRDLDFAGPGLWTASVMTDIVKIIGV